jgi:ribosomal protein S18 acetylase RimI-like enzyme
MQNDSTIAIKYTSLDYVTSLNKTTDIVARERKYLATVSGYPLEGTKSFVSFIIDNNFAQYVLISNQEVIGWCDIIPMSIPEFSHIGVLGMGLLREYRGKGLGRELLMKAIEHAKIKNKIEKIELHVFESNTNAIKLYKKIGFTEEGIKSKARKIDGYYDNEVLMGLFV